MKTLNQSRSLHLIYWCSWKGPLTIFIWLILCVCLEMPSSRLPVACQFGHRRHDQSSYFQSATWCCWGISSLLCRRRCRRRRMYIHMYFSLCDAYCRADRNVVNCRPAAAAATKQRKERQIEKNNVRNLMIHLLIIIIVYEYMFPAGFFLLFVNGTTTPLPCLIRREREIGGDWEK